MWRRLINLCAKQTIKLILFLIINIMLALLQNQKEGNEGRLNITRTRILNL